MKEEADSRNELRPYTQPTALGTGARYEYLNWAYEIADMPK